MGSVDDGITVSTGVVMGLDGVLAMVVEVADIVVVVSTVVIDCVDIDSEVQHVV